MTTHIDRIAVSNLIRSVLALQQPNGFIWCWDYPTSKSPSSFPVYVKVWRFWEEADTFYQIHEKSPEPTELLVSYGADCEKERHEYLFLREQK